MSPRSAAPCASVPQLRAWFVRQIKAQSPDAEIVWTLPLRRVTFPTGMRGITGQAQVTAPGFKARTMLVTADPYGKSAR